MCLYVHVGYVRTRSYIGRARARHSAWRYPVFSSDEERFKVCDWSIISVPIEKIKLLRARIRANNDFVHTLGNNVQPDSFPGGTIYPVTPAPRNNKMLLGYFKKTLQSGRFGYVHSTDEADRAKELFEKSTSSRFVVLKSDGHYGKQSRPSLSTVA